MFQKTFLCLFLTSSIVCAMEKEPESPLVWSYSYPIRDESSFKKMNLLFNKKKEGPYPEQFQPRVNCLMVNSALPKEEVEKKYASFFEKLKGDFTFFNIPADICITFNKVIALEDIKDVNNASLKEEPDYLPYIQLEPTEEGVYVLKVINKEAVEVFKKAWESNPDAKKDLSVRYMSAPENYNWRMTFCRGFGNEALTPKEKEERVKNAVAALEKNIPKQEFYLDLKGEGKFASYPSALPPVYSLK